MSERPVVALINNSLTPYRLHYHRRIVRELTEIEIASVFTHDESNSPWAGKPPVDIHPVPFGIGQPSGQQSKIRFALREWRKGGRIIAWMREHAVRAVVLGGYNDPGRLRIIRHCRHAGVPCFLFGDSNIRGDTTSGVKACLKQRILRRVLKDCAGVLPCGTLGQEYFAKYGVPVERMFHCPYEPDYDQIANVTAQQIVDACRRFRLPEHHRRVLYSGRLAREKRVDLALAAFTALSAEYGEWDLVILGNGPLAAPLRDAVPAHLANRVHWLGFVDDAMAVAAINRACDLLVLPSDYEPWAVVVNEATAAGLAIVASDSVGAAADLVRDGVNGRTHPRGDLAALTGALTEAISNVDSFKAASLNVLADWRKRADPVDGLRQALRASGVLNGR